MRLAVVVMFGVGIQSGRYEFEHVLDRALVHSLYLLYIYILAGI